MWTLICQDVTKALHSWLQGETENAVK